MRHLVGEPHQLPGTQPLSGYAARHFQFAVRDAVATITLNRPERKNPLTFESYAELRDLFRALVHAPDVKVVVITGAGENFCSGGDVHEIIGPLTKLDMPGLLDVYPHDRRPGQGHARLPAADRRGNRRRLRRRRRHAGPGVGFPLGTARSKTAFLFTRVGLAGCDMGACALLPRVIGQGRAAELLVYRPQHGRRGSRTLGILQSPVRAGALLAGCAGPGRASSPPADVRARDDQEDAASGMEHGG